MNVLCDELAAIASANHHVYVHLHVCVDLTGAILRKLEGRLAPTLDKAATVAHCLALIRESYDSYSTRQYDNFQWMTNGIMP
jgi:hypothetical protein